MDTKSFLKEIRSIIREEIEYALEKRNKNESKEINLEALKHGLELFKQQSKQKVVETKQHPKQKQQTKSGLSIQSILDETRRSIQESYDSENEFGEMRFTSDMVPGRTSSMIPSGYDESQITPEVSKALTRDYSALMAKINEKTGR